MITPQEKTIELVDKYRVILMSEDTDCGNEILCTKISKECALIAVDVAMEFITGDLSESFDKTLYLLEVKEEIIKL